MVSLTIPGRCVPAARMTRRSMHVRPEAIRYLAYQRYVATLCLTVQPRPLPWEQIAVLIRVYVRGKRRGDWDNYGKSICDSLQAGGVISNDKLITEGCVQIISVDSPADERTEVELMDVSGPVSG